MIMKPMFMMRTMLVILQYHYTVQRTSETDSEHQQILRLLRLKWLYHCVIQKTRLYLH